MSTATDASASFEIERLIGMLDTIDGDEHLEPWLASNGYTEDHRLVIDDREGDPCDLGEPDDDSEPGGDEEPSIGWANPMGWRIGDRCRQI